MLENDHGGTAQLVTLPQHGSLVSQPNGLFQYAPSQNFSGTDTFAYTAGGDAATVTLAVASSTIRRS